MSKHNGKITRLMQYTVVKADKPGVFKGHAGGISARLGDIETHTAEAKAAIQQLLQEFPDYIQLPKEGAKKLPPLGVFFKKSEDLD